MSNPMHENYPKLIVLSRKWDDGIPSDAAPYLGPSKTTDDAISRLACGRGSDWRLTVAYLAIIILPFYFQQGVDPPTGPVTHTPTI